MRKCKSSWVCNPRVVLEKILNCENPSEGLMLLLCKSHL